ncbi:MAG: hypothetical protein MJ252_26940 [archaeon]|nr:hypothetical protein [archaeon]
MKYQIAFIFIISLIISGISSEELTQLEKDRYLACNAIMVTKTEHDKDIIDETFKGKDSFLVKGLRRVLNLEMLLKCVENISDASVHELYENYFAKVAKVDLTKYNIDFDYTPYKTKHEFIYEPRLVKAMQTLRKIVEERDAIKKKMDEKREAAKAEKKEDKPEEKKEDKKAEGEKASQKDL